MGYAMWNFQGPFGIIDHYRPGARLEHLSGYNVDRVLLDQMLENRVADDFQANPQQRSSDKKPWEKNLYRLGEFLISSLLNR
jgi:hypothetical protein